MRQIPCSDIVVPDRRGKRVPGGAHTKITD
jgi:hypothetical protein